MTLLSEFECNEAPLSICPDSIFFLGGRGVGEGAYDKVCGYPVPPRITYKLDLPALPRTSPPLPRCAQHGTIGVGQCVISVMYHRHGLSIPIKKKRFMIRQPNNRHVNKRTSQKRKERGSLRAVTDCRL